jgi:hypothetical protein
MFHELFYSLLNHGLRVAFSALPAMPLLGQKRLAPRVENIVLVHGAFAEKRMGAVTTILPTCHMVILEEPAKVAAVIDEAARTLAVSRTAQEV